MDTLFSGKGLLLIDALAALLLFMSIHGYAAVLFTPLGRISRITFWEEMAAWFLLNVFAIILGIAHVAFPFEDEFATGLGDTDHVLYHNMVMVFTLVYWVVSLWIFAVLCAKRWHDLNFSGWLALINALPVLTFAAAGWVFIDSVSRTMNHSLAIDSRYSPFDLWKEVYRTGLPTLNGWSYWSFALSCGLVLALGAYLGFAAGDTGANVHGKNST